MEIATLVLLSALPALVIAAGLSDLTTMRIPNWLSGALMVSFFPAALIVGLPLETVGIHLAVGFAALMAGMGLFALKVIGGGDAKLMAAALVWLGLPGAAPFILSTAVIGGLFCAALIAARKTMVPYTAGAPAWVSMLMRSDGDVPYGVAIAIGALMAFPSSGLVLRFIAG